MAGSVAPETDRTHVRLAELVAALSLGIDLGFGQPMEHVLRQCLIALRLPAGPWVGRGGGGGGGSRRHWGWTRSGARPSTTPPSSSTWAATPTRTSRRSGSATTSR